MGLTVEQTITIMDIVGYKMVGSIIVSKRCLATAFG